MDEQKTDRMEDRRADGATSPGETRDAAAGREPAPDGAEAAPAEPHAEHAGMMQRERERESEAPESSVQLEELQQELNTLNDRHLRLAAEFDNYRKRVDRERAELTVRSQANLVGQLLDVLDDLERVAHVEAGSTSVEALLEGVQLVEKKLRQALGSAGLERLDPAGEFFDPAAMEALMTVPAEHPEEDDVVADVFQPGYRFKSQLLRPARVRVKKYEE